MCRAVQATKMIGSSSDNRFISTLVTHSLLITFNYWQHSAVADLHNFQFTVVHALALSVSTSRLLATDLNTDTITSNHYEVFWSSVTLPPIVTPELRTLSVTN
jgi:hypothetical protein